GKSFEELLELMDKETWLTPQQALELGLIDEIMFEENIKLTANVGIMLPENVVNKVRNTLNQKQDSNVESRLKSIEAQLESINKTLNNQKLSKKIENNWLF